MAELHPAQLPPAGVREWALWLIRKRKRYRVTGASMFPLLKPGDEVLLDTNAYARRAPAAGDIVVAGHPSSRHLRIIKRVAAVRRDGTLSLLGENPFESTDFHSLPASQIIGRVTCKFSEANIAAE